MDLSAIIFVVLALAWAVYLIPKALKHHDELASDRLVEGHSDKVRILARKRRTVVTETIETLEPEVEVSAPIEDAPPPSRPTRAAARKAAQRRRRVLGVLVVAFIVVWTFTWFAYLPYMTPAIPGALVVAWLVIARLSVRKQQQRRRTTMVVAPVAVEPEPVRATAPAPSASRDMVDLLADEDLSGSSRREVEAVLADDGSLWDPLPMTLPTYVNKARARRTVRTIELTGINSSGHDEADTALARDASGLEQSAQATTEAEAEQRRVAGA